MRELYHLFRSTTGVVTDSRQLIEGCMFFALKGPTFNGNDFAKEALEKGAAYAVVDEHKLSGRPGMVVVDDVLNALQQLALQHRRQFNFPVIGITGSNGKTTTKELVAVTLQERFKVHCTQGNLNNHIGVPLTLLRMPEDTEVAVIEMGANHQGEIAALSAITEPTHGLITNIGKAHLEGFGGLEGVKKGKSELYKFLAASNGVAFVNRDEPFLIGLSSPVSKRVFYRVSEVPSLDEPDYEVQLVRQDPSLAIAFLGEDGNLVYADTQLSGWHNLANLSTAVAVGKYFKAPASGIVTALESYIPSNNRSEWVHWKGNRVFLDAYNANPTSMRFALEWFARQPEKPKTAVLGAMLELGEYSEEEHIKIVNGALELNIDQLILVGEGFEIAGHLLTGAHTYYRELGHLIDVWKHNPPQRHSILIKGSRGLGMEKLLDQTERGH